MRSEAERWTHETSRAERVAAVARRTVTPDSSCGQTYPFAAKDGGLGRRSSSHVTEADDGKVFPSIDTSEIEDEAALDPTYRSRGWSPRCRGGDASDNAIEISEDLQLDQAKSAPAQRRERAVPRRIPRLAPLVIAAINLDDEAAPGASEVDDEVGDDVSVRRDAFLKFVA